ncbi:MAG: TonB-dependent receptor [Roseateles asaccharophilus]|uniref:Iron complex outermembrane receptor protein n=1 Tax=Roseateles asaccharophilus TaxID=582607 RepID=A0A4R6NDV8_9BURK|nr:TonB-dependent receptor [Roseateles asaccharophilus]MDN3543087.1 TonB-dependent receptor [Roseateles asaccharophilus]TDP13215.1 iron complex outermembrane receptor protein [Roseateles asaccharophilus]
MRDIKPQALRPVQLALSVSLALSAWPVLAQSSDKTQLETVTITAERRVENIKDVPTAVSTLSGEKLDVLASGGQDVRFLSGRVPSLNIESSFGRAFPRFYLRGYGNTDFRLNASQPVSLIYDDVVQENPILKGFPVFDVKSVEVIAGPQGTLFGRNTPGGVVKFDSVRPSKKQDGYISASYGTFGSATLEGAANLPLGGDWSARVSAQLQRRDDWVTNQVPNSPTSKTEGYEDRAVRLQALYEPNQGFSALFNLHNRELEGSPRLFRASIIKPGTNDLIAGFDPKKSYLNAKNEQSLHATGGSLRIKWALDGMTLHSITGIETVKPFSRADVDGGYILRVIPSNFKLPPYDKEGEVFFPVETSDALRDHRQLSQEVRLESSGNGPLRWQAGLYLFDERYTMESIDYLAAPADALVSTRQTNRAWAVFGSVNYRLSADLNLRGGLRYTQDKKNLSTTGKVNTSAGTSASTDNSKVSWDLSGTYTLSPETNLYARVATGFRAASIYPASGFGPQSQARPETVTSYELGAKSEFWQRRGRLSATVFSYTVKDQQLTAVGGTQNVNTLLNASKGQGRGFELNLELLPTDNLLLTLGASYNDTEIKDRSLAMPPAGSGATMIGTPDAQGNYSIYGNPLPNAPKWIANLTARYSIPTADGNEYYIYTDWAYRSKVNFFLYRAVEFTGKPLTEGGLRVGYLWNNGKYEVAGFVRNITDKVVVNGAIDFNNLTGFINDPRTYGVQFKALF